MKIVVEYGKHNLFSGVPIKLVIQSIEELYKRFEATKFHINQFTIEKG